VTKAQLIDPRDIEVEPINKTALGITPHSGRRRAMARWLIVWPIPVYPPSQLIRPPQKRDCQLKLLVFRSSKRPMCEFLLQLEKYWIVHVDGNYTKPSGADPSISSGSLFRLTLRDLGRGYMNARLPFPPSSACSTGAAPTCTQ
jgi:hypothetical protein